MSIGEEWGEVEGHECGWIQRSSRKEGGAGIVSDMRGGWCGVTRREEGW